MWPGVRDATRDPRGRSSHRAFLEPVAHRRSARRPRQTVVLARHVHNRRLADALHQQAFCALNASPGARAYYDSLRARGAGHHAALRQLSNRLVGILHGCLKTRTLYDEDTARAHHTPDRLLAA